VGTGRWWNAKKIFNFENKNLGGINYGRPTKPKKINKLLKPVMTQDMSLLNSSKGKISLLSN